MSRWKSPARQPGRIGARMSGYRCFATEAQGFDEVLPINVLIGQNNVGKSSMLDMIEALVGARSKTPSISSAHFSTQLTEGDLRAGFPESTRGGDVPEANHWEFARKFVGATFDWSIRFDGGKSHAVATRAPSKAGSSGWDRLATVLGNPFEGAQFYKLAAAREVTAQPFLDLRTSEGWKPDGSSVTALVNSFSNMSTLPSEAITETLLGELNKLVSPVIVRAIVPRATTPDGSLWELYIEEENKGRVPLSASGAGYKTLVSTLALVELLPRLHDVDLAQCIFALEELENNLHPALQRRLLAYLRERAEQAGATFFLTTHSSVVIDVFEGDRMAQIVHVEHDGKQARSKTVTNRAGFRNLLDDLDVRASDLLQTNCIVWVEGPSDRKYFNRWVELWSDGLIREGAHYRCVFYGGKLLSHLGGDDSAEEQGLISLLGINRNAILIMDRDKGSADEPVNFTKQRVSREVEASGGIAWLTAGREIEHYIPPSILEPGPQDETRELSSIFESFSSTLERVSPSKAATYARSKVAFSDAICPILTKATLAQHLDLATRLDTVLNAIRKWNSIRPPGGS